jgi:hypothetical protein
MSVEVVETSWINRVMLVVCVTWIPLSVLPPTRPLVEAIQQAMVVVAVVNWMVNRVMRAALVD